MAEQPADETAPLRHLHVPSVHLQPAELAGQAGDAPA
eukprot:COSAG02_NODE_56428_length_285_cov_1.349462_1_plen_36_part_10